MSLDEFAALHARMEAGEGRDRVLAEAGLSPEAWLEAQGVWLGRMASLAVHGEPALHQRYLGLLGEHQQAERSRRAAPASPPAGKMPRPPALPALPPVGPSERADARRASRAARPAASGEAAKPAKDARKKMAVTMMMEESVVARPALPFDRPGRGSSPPPAAAPSRPKKGRLQRQTLANTLPAFLQSLGPALPFAESSAPRADPRSSSKPRGLDDRFVLPFGRRDEPAGAATGQGATRGKRSDDRFVLPFNRQHEAAAAPRTDGAAPGGQAAPGLAAPAQGRAADPSTAPAMGLELYAWLCAAIAFAPERTEQTLTWMRLTPEDKRALDALWEKVFAGDPAQRAAFEHARQGYLDRARGK